MKMTTGQLPCRKITVVTQSRTRALTRSSQCRLIASLRLALPISGSAAANRLGNLKVVRIFHTERDRPVVREGFDYGYLQRKSEWQTKHLQDGVDGFVLALINGRRRVGSVDHNSIEVLRYLATWNRCDCHRCEM